MLNKLRLNIDSKTDVQRNLINVPTFEEMSILKVNPRRLKVFEKRNKEIYAEKLKLQANTMKFVDQMIKVTNFINEKDLGKFKFSYRDISPSLPNAGGT